VEQLHFQCGTCASSKRDSRSQLCRCGAETAYWKKRVGDLSDLRTRDQDALDALHLRLLDAIGSRVLLAEAVDVIGKRLLRSSSSMNIRTAGLKLRALARVHADKSRISDTAWPGVLGPVDTKARVDLEYFARQHGGRRGHQG
jgi:hypothetical protein